MSRRFFLVVGAAVGVAVGVYWLLPALVEAGYFAPAAKTPTQGGAEASRLRSTWGPETYSEREEDLKIQDFFADREDGFFVDVGAFDYKDRSNTYLLEVRHGWSGIAIDALDEFRAGYETHRPKTKFFSFYVSDTSDESIQFYVVEGRHNQSTGVKDKADTKPQGYDTIEVQQITLDHLLELEGVDSIDFLNMDIELAEPAALRGFDIETYRPALVCIEMHPPVSGEIRDYFHQAGYVEDEIWSDLDPKNSFFVRSDLLEGFHQRRAAALAAFEASLSES